MRCLLSCAASTPITWWAEAAQLPGCVQHASTGQRLLHGAQYSMQGCAMASFAVLCIMCHLCHASLPSAGGGGHRGLLWGERTSGEGYVSGVFFPLEMCSHQGKM